MIEDLRFVKRYVPSIKLGDAFLEERKILQAYDGHVWFDVPLVDESFNTKDKQDA